MNGYTIIEILLSLSFIYVVYSLLATIIVEIIASVFRLRARMLRRAIRRMLQDQDENNLNWDQVRGYFQGSHLDRDFTARFFDHPTIKYLGKNWLMKTPSYIGRDVFAKTVIDILTEEDGITDLKSVENSLGYYEQFDKRMSVPQAKWDEFLTKVEQEQNEEQQTNMIDDWLKEYKVNYLEKNVAFTDMEVKNVIKKISCVKSSKMKIALLKAWVKDLQGAVQIEDETRYQLNTLYKQSGRSLNGFYILLGDWFDNTMDRTKGWYKKKISRITFCVGLFIAIGFNVDSIYIVETLQEDTAKRESMMVMIDNAETDSLKTMTDSLQQHQTDINSVIALSDDSNRDPEKPWKHWLGWLLTAVALSLGAPFWFDLLNKLVKLKTSVPPPPKSPDTERSRGAQSEGKYVELKNDIKG